MTDTSSTALAPFKRLSVVRSMKRHRGAVNVVRFTWGGRYCVTGGADRSICLWNPHRSAEATEGSDTGALLIAEFRGHGYDVADVAIARDNSMLVSCGGDKCAYVWDVASRGITRRVFGHEHRLTCVAVNEEATGIVTGAHDKTVRVWDLRSANRTAIQTLTHFRDNVTRVWTGRYEVIASSMDGCVRKFDMRVGRVITDTFGSPVADFALSNDGNCVLAALPGAPARIALMEKSTGGLLSLYHGHTHALYALGLAFSADDAVVVSASEDGTIVAWDLVKPDEMVRIPAHSRVVSSVSVLPHTHTHTHTHTHMLLTASYDGTAKLWSVGGEDAAGFS